MTINLEMLTLSYGGHGSRGDGTCLLEAVAWFAGEPHTDHPACVSPLLTSFGIGLNDQLPSDSKRAELIPAIARMPGTAGDGKDLARSYLASDWLNRVYAPAFLELVPALSAHAEALRQLPAIRDSSTLLSSAQTSAAARDAAWAAALAAAGDAARDAAGDAAWAAARDAARDAAWAAARDAARDAAGDAAGDAAWDAAWAAAGAAARAAAGDAAGDAAGAAAGDAAGDAARGVLQPVVDRLQDSAIALLFAMIDA